MNTQPQRIQRRRGEAFPPNTKSVKRPTKWGNPFKDGVTKNDTPEEAAAKRAGAVAQFAQWLECTPEGHKVRDAAPRELRGFNLACACPLDGPCHGEILLRIANATREMTRSDAFERAGVERH